MKQGLLPVILAFGFAAVAISSGAPRVLAWTGMGVTWPNPSATYDKHTLASNWQGVADFGAAQWTNVTPSPWTWTSDNSSNNDVTTGGIDGRGRTLAITTVYYNPQNQQITRMTMKFDSSERWYLGSGNPTSSQVDGRSVSAHEFGHGLGQGHTQSSNCPNNSNRATMCSSYLYGTSYQRTLETDDRNGVNSLYP